MKWFAVGLMFFCSVAMADDKKSPVDGSWKPTKAEVSGNALPAELLESITLTIKEGKYEVSLAGQMDKGTCTADPSTKPHRLKIVGEDGPNKGKTMLAIYELKDDQLTVCYDSEGKEYPKEFKSPADSKLLLLVYKKAK